MTTHHPLDRPVWSSLTTRQAPLSLGDARALRFAPDYGLFAAVTDTTPESLAALAALIPADGQVALVEAAEPPAVPGTAIESRSNIWQMVLQGLTPAGPPDFEIVPLTEADAPQMLALATLTRPGPFFSRTHQLGDFVGVKREGRLLAMAGERMQPAGFTEVSGVCTDPDHRGRGYAGALMRVAAGRIIARGETAFLHTYAHNTGAIGLYESLGFAFRRELGMTVLSRA
ncbi:GNAT family N-acetyltransferase [Phenylobacterium sp.]|uniref:GNAT family N-acetyltransferase n=1 Tax=Phenylobacterium sp. TaxID=1871053 RepID=UPI0035651E5B